MDLEKMIIHEGTSYVEVIGDVEASERCICFLDNGNILLCGRAGKYELFGKDMSSIKSGTWKHGTSHIYTSLQLDNGNILLSGVDGKYELLDKELNSIKSGTWKHGDSNIYTSLQLDNGNILLGGRGGRYELLDKDMNSIKFGTWKHGASRIYTSLQLDNGNILLSGQDGKYELLDKDLNSIKSGTWKHGTGSRIYTSLQLGSGNILLSGSEGRYELLDKDLNSIKSGTWKHGTNSIYTSLQLDNGSILLSGGSGGYELLDKELSSIKSGVLHGGSDITSSAYDKKTNRFILAGYSSKFTIFQDEVIKIEDVDQSKGQVYEVDSNKEVKITGKAYVYNEQGKLTLSSGDFSQSIDITPLESGESLDESNFSFTVDMGEIKKDSRFTLTLSSGDKEVKDDSIVVLYSQEQSDLGDLIKTGTVLGGSNIGTYEYGERVSLQLDNGNILLSGSSGKYELLDKDLNSIKSGVWKHGTNHIYTSLQLDSGNVLLGGEYGRYELLDKDLNSIKSGTWGHGSSRYIFTSLQLDNGNIFLGGSSGKYELLDKELNSIKSGTWKNGSDYSIYTSLQLDNGNVRLGGQNRKYELLDKDMNSIKSGNWSYGSGNIYTSLQLDDGNILLSGGKGQCELLDKDSNSIKLETWKHGSRDIYTSLQLDNGNILLVGQYGKYELLDKELNSIKSGVWKHGAHNIYTSLQLDNGNILLGGSNGKYQVSSINSLYFPTIELSRESIISGNKKESQVVISGELTKREHTTSPMEVIVSVEDKVYRREVENNILPKANTFSIDMDLSSLAEDTTIEVVGKYGKEEVRKSLLLRVILGYVEGLGTLEKTGIALDGNQIGGVWGEYAICILDNGNILLSGNNGRYELLDKNLNSIKSGQWKHGVVRINTSLQLDNGNILLGGEYNGKYELFDKDLNSIKSGTWGNGSSNINTSLQLDNGNILLGGNSGNYELFDRDLDSIKSGTWKHGSNNIFTSLQLDNGNILLGGGNGGYELLDEDMDSIKAGTWKHESKSINTSLQLNNGNILLSGNGGNYELFDRDLDSIKSGTWKHGSNNIFTSLQLDNGNILLGGGNGGYELLDEDFNTISHWQSEKQKYLYESAYRNGLIVIGGQAGYYEVYREYYLPQVISDKKDLGDLDSRTYFQYKIVDKQEDGGQIRLTEYILTKENKKIMITENKEVSNNSTNTVFIEEDMIFKLSQYETHYLVIELSSSKGTSREEIPFRVVNTPPILEDKTESTVLYENTSLHITGSALEKDDGDILSIFFEYSGKRYALNSKLSDGKTPLPYDAKLLYKDGKLYHKDTVLDKDFEDDTEYFVKIYAQDDKGAKSEEVVVPFTVVTNRPAEIEITKILPVKEGTSKDKVLIFGEIYDKDGNESTLLYQVGGKEIVEFETGKDREFVLPIPVSEFPNGRSVVTLYARDSYGAQSEYPIKFEKVADEFKTDFAVRHYRITPPKDKVKGVLFWVQHDRGDLELDVEIAYGKEPFRKLESNLESNVDYATVEQEYYDVVDEPRNIDNLYIRIIQKTGEVETDSIKLVSGVFV